VLKIAKVEEQDDKISFGIYCKLLTKNYIYKEKEIVLIPRVARAILFKRNH
jgi:hypothetical protein